MRIIAVSEVSQYLRRKLDFTSYKANFSGTSSLLKLLAIQLQGNWVIISFVILDHFKRIINIYILSIKEKFTKYDQTNGRGHLDTPSGTLVSHLYYTLHLNLAKK